MRQKYFHCSDLRLRSGPLANQWKFFQNLKIAGFLLNPEAETVQTKVLLTFLYNKREAHRRVSA